MSSFSNEAGPFKVALVGPHGSGKTSIVMRFHDKVFSANVVSTIGALYIIENVSTRQCVIALEVWDTAGQEKYRSLCPMYTRGAVGLIVVYDVAAEDSLDDAKTWREQSRGPDSDASQAISVVANKIDLVSDTGVTEPGREYAESIGASFCITSAKTGEGIQGLFGEIAERLMQIHLQGARVEVARAVPDAHRKQCC
jgi:Ras-related protein Rab-5C